MEAIILDAVSWEPDHAALHRQLRLAEGSEAAEDFAALLAEAQRVARPKAAYGAAYLTGRDEAGVEVDGVRLQSRVVAINLERAHRVFPYLVTCGVEVDAWAHTQEDILYQFWAEAIKESALAAAQHALRAHLDALYRPGRVSSMNPGSLADWPLPQQRPFFALLGPAAPAIGVELSASHLMTPNKSVSGLFFPTAEDWASCQLCPREGCPNRRAPYDAALWQERYSAVG